MPLPTIVRHGKQPDIIEFDNGFAAIITKSADEAANIAAALIERFNHHPHLVSLLQRLSDAVEALEGTSDEADALVDEYRAILTGLGV